MDGWFCEDFCFLSNLDIHDQKPSSYKMGPLPVVHGVITYNLYEWPYKWVTIVFLSPIACRPTYRWFMGPSCRVESCRRLCLLNATLKPRRCPRQSPEPSSYRQRRFRSGIGAHVWGPTQSGTVGEMVILEGWRTLLKKNEHGSQEWWCWTWVPFETRGDVQVPCWFLGGVCVVPFSLEKLLSCIVSAGSCITLFWQGFFAIELKLSHCIFGFAL